MKYFYLALSLLASHTLYSQDDYHLGVLEYLNTNYGLENPSFLLSDSESQNLNDLGYYGAQRISESVTGYDFTLKHMVNIANGSSNAWDAGVNIRTKAAISKGDAIIFTFWAKENSQDSEIFPFLENATTYEKEFYQSLELTPDWTQYFVTIISANDYTANRMSIGFHLASIKQNFDLAGLTLLNFGQGYSIKDLPNSFSAGGYGGSDINDPWRSEATQRIEEIRKSNITINVVDLGGNPIPDADIQLEMEKHAFGFGSALVTCKFPGNSCYDPTYIDKVTNLDGKGHGFNVAVTENDLKWDAWEEEWFSTPAQNVKAIQWLADKGIAMRGHTLFWPGFNMMPDDIQLNKNNLPYLRERIDGRINSMINHPELSDLVRDWDILNEITTNREFENSFRNDANFSSGREIYLEILKKVHDVDPNIGLYINDYIVLSGGGSTQTTINRYKTFLDEMYAGEIPFDGIGFQSHIGPTPTSILKVKEVFDEFSTRYNAKLKVTEYDISPNVDEETQAKYLSDFLTMTFSHPAQEAFIMWGFYDGNHWKDNAPMYDQNWNLKPSGQAFIDKVFGEWWSEESTTSDQQGKAVIRAFKGQHKITATKDGISKSGSYFIDKNQNVQITLDITTTIDDLQPALYDVFPNPTKEGYSTIVFDGQLSITIKVYSTSGILISEINDIKSGDSVEIADTSGMYILHLISNDKTDTKTIFVDR